MSNKDKKTIIKHFSVSDEAFNNPYMGYMPFASTLTKIDYPDPDFSLAFALIFWSNVEAEKNAFDFSAFENDNNFTHLRKHNIKIVIRIVTDYPSETQHFDIPDWLYNEMNGAGTYYQADNPHSTGFAPDYQNIYFIERHELLINAVANRYDDSPDVAFIQLGSLGHWGEWHNVYVPGEYFPPKKITDLYIKQYLSAFKNTIIQMRKPFTIMKDYEIGLFNDMIGHAGQTNWLKNEIYNHGLEDFFLFVPMGGEFASTNTINEYFGELYEDVKKMITDTNVTYVGCLPPSDPEYDDNRSDLLKIMGYRFYITSVEYNPYVKRDESIEFFITIRNNGIAPFYYKWYFYILIYDNDDLLVREHQLDDWVRDIIPGGIYIMAAEINNLKEGSYLAKLGLFDPLNKSKEKADIRLANAKLKADNLLTVGKFYVGE